MTLTNSPTGQFGFSYEGLSPRTQRTRPKGVNTSYAYRPVSRPLAGLQQAGSTTFGEKFLDATIKAGKNLGED